MTRLMRVGSLGVIIGIALVSAVGGASATEPPRTLSVARAGFNTKRVAAPAFESSSAPEPPAGSPFSRVRYRSPQGSLVAYLTRAPSEGAAKRPAVLWAHGGFGGVGLDDLAEVQPLVDAGLVVMVPAWRGENDNPGRFELFYGEVDDALAALDHLAALPYVDAEQLYVVGHSSGGTLALLVATASDRPRGVVSLGGLADVEALVAEGGYVDPPLPFPADDPREAELRSPLRFATGIRVPTFYFEGARSAALLEGARRMEAEAKTRSAPFVVEAVLGADHFEAVQPLLGLIGAKIAAGQLAFTPGEAQVAFAKSRSPSVLLYAPLELELELALGGAEPCHIWPQTDDESPACERFEPELARAATGKGKKPVAMVMADLGDWVVMVNVMAQLEMATLGDVADRERFATGMQQGLEKARPGSRLRGPEPGTQYSMVRLADRDVLMTNIELEVPEDSPERIFNRSISYVVPVRKELVLVQFSGDALHVEALRRVAHETMATLKIAPPPAKVDKAFQLGQAIGRIVVSLSVLSMVVFVVVRLVRATRSDA